MAAGTRASNKRAAAPANHDSANDSAAEQPAPKRSKRGAATNAKKTTVDEDIEDDADPAVAPPKKVKKPAAKSKGKPGATQDLEDDEVAVPAKTKPDSRAITKGEDDDESVAKPAKSKAKGKTKVKAQGPGDEDEVKSEDAQAGAAKIDFGTSANDASASAFSDAQFAKAKNLLVHVDEECQMPSYQVHIDSDGIIYDAALNQTNAGNNNNKFYKIQVCRRRLCSHASCPVLMLSALDERARLPHIHSLGSCR